MNSVKPRIIVPNQKLARVYHHMAQGLHAYDEDSLWTPDSDAWKSCVLNLTPPLKPRTATSPTQYWFDKSRYQNHGAITGAVWKQLPNGAWVLSFGGVDDVIKVAHHASLNTLSALSILGWCKPTSMAGTETIYFKAVGATWVAPYASYAVRIAASKITLGTAIAGVWAEYSSTTALTLNAWNHFGVTWDGSIIRWYLNGAPNGTQALVGTLDTSVQVVRIGGNELSAEMFNGILGEILHYNRVLTAQEIQQNYPATKWRYQ